MRWILKTPIGVEDSEQNRNTSSACVVGHCDIQMFDQ